MSMRKKLSLAYHACLLLVVVGGVVAAARPGSTMDIVIVPSARTRSVRILSCECAVGLQARFWTSARGFRTRVASN